LPASFTTTEILDQFDACIRECTFPMLDNGCVYPVDVRLEAYRDETRWAVVIEVVGFHYRAGGFDGISNCLHLFGNCLKRRPGTANEDFLYPTSDGSQFDHEFGATVRPDAKSIRIRDMDVPLRLSQSAFEAAGIDLLEPPTVYIYELLRLLSRTHRRLFLATEEELRDRVPPDLPMILRLDEWHHPDLAGDELPSENETFQMISDVLVSGDAGVYQPTLVPNTHWSNWPAGGTL
jgi:hypothetical protein